MVRALRLLLIVVSSCLLANKAFNQTVPSAPTSIQYAPEYVMPSRPGILPTNLREICYNDTDLVALRKRMLQQELNVGVLQCSNRNNERTFERQYVRFLKKFERDLADNVSALREIAGRRRLNVDVVVTEFANRTAQHAAIDRVFCWRIQQALEWSLDDRVASLQQVPPPIDLGPEMNIHACAKS